VTTTFKFQRLDGIGRGSVYWNGVAPAKNMPVSKIYLHGMCGDPSVYEPWLSKDADLQTPAFAVQFRGHGDSDQSMLGAASFDDYVADALSCVAHVGPANVIAHSMGALVQQKLALSGSKYVKYIQKQVLITSAPPAGMLLKGLVLWRIWRYILPMARKMPFTLTQRDAKDLLFNRFPDDALENGLRTMGFESGRVVWQISTHQIWIKPIGIPTLVIAAEHDNITHPDIQRKIAYRHGGRLVTLKGACHMIPLQPDIRDEAFNVITNWLN